MSAKSIMQKATEIYLLLFASLHLLYFGFSGYSNIFMAKKITFCTITSLYFLCAAVCVFLFRHQEKKSIRRFIYSKFTAVHICVLIYLLITLISGLASLHFPDTIFGVSRFEGMFTIAFYCISFILVSLFPCRKRYILTVFSISVVLFSLLGILQITGLNPLSLYPENMNFYDAGIRYTTAFLGTIGNTNLVGAFICLTLPFLAVIMLKAKSPIRFLLLIPITLLVFVTAKMGVDSAILALIATAVVTLPLIFDFSKKSIIAYFLVITILAVFCLLFIYFHAPQSGMPHELSEILHGNISDEFGSGRIRIWKNVMSEIHDSPIIGKGPDTMKKEQFEPFSRFYPKLNKVMKTNIDVAHNEFLNILYHQGILGLCAYMGFIFFVAKKWLKNKKDILIHAFGVAFLCYLIQSFFTFSMCLVAPYFWICAGMIIGLSESICLFHYDS